MYNLLAPLGALRILFLLTAPVIKAQEAQETIFASIAFIRTGERLPLVDAERNVTTLTPFGAQQMSSLGSLFRNHYMPQNQSAIQGLSVNELVGQQTFILADDTPYSMASAQAFMQSLYPPFEPSSESSSSLSNGTKTQFPIGGYQYPWIQSVYYNDERSIYLDGSLTCDAFTLDDSYTNSSDYQEASLNSQKLYEVVGGTLGNSDLPASDINFDNAWGVYDYMSYAYNHNDTIKSFFAPNGTLNGTLDQLRAYSNVNQWLQYGETDPTGNLTLNTVAGQTISLAILALFAQALQSNGDDGKLSLLFGEYPAMLSFAALANLPETNTAFYGVPDYASTMVFELFSLTSNTLSDTSDLRVRFLFANGTDTIDSPMASSLMAYPIFNSGSQDLSLDDFIDTIGQVALPDTPTWCDICDSWDTVPFCMFYNSTAWNAANGVTSSGKNNANSSGMMSPSLAGVVGAVATLAALGVFLVFAVGCCGMRIVQRKNPQSTQAAGGATAARGGIGGFKGNQKLASDPDLTDLNPKGPQSDKHNSGISFGNNDRDVIGHERVGSWELKQPKRAVSTKSRDEEEGWGIDALGKEVKPNERV